MHTMFILLVIAVLIIGAGLYAFAPHPPATPRQVSNQAELDTYLEHLVASGSPPGLSVVVVKDGKVVYNNAFGYADAPAHLKATPDTIYHWWSMTKIPTAMAILQLKEQGKLDLDDNVARFLPWFEVKNPAGNNAPIKIRNLLQHSSGLPDTMPAMMSWVHYNDGTYDQTEVLKKHLPEFNSLKFEPGSKAVYSNLNYMVLGAVIESVSGHSYESFIEENILQPLGMLHTSFVVSPGMTGIEAAGTLPVVHFYTPLLPFFLDTNSLVRERSGRLLWLNRFYIDATPSTGLIGSASDVAKLLAVYLNHGTLLEGETILSPESISMMTTATPLDGRGLGWAVGDSEGEFYLEHMGGGPGFATTMRIYPNSNLGIAILSNGTDLDRTGLADLLQKLDW